LRIFEFSARHQGEDTGLRASNTKRPELSIGSATRYEEETSDVTVTLDDRVTGATIGTGPVLVADAHQLVGETLQTTLALHGINVSVWACTHPEAILDEVWAVRPALVLLDLALAGVGRDWDLIRPLVDQGIVVLVLAGTAERLELARCMEAGAAGVLSKESSFDTVLEAIRAALNGEPVTPVRIRAQYLAELDEHRRSIRSATARFDDLTPRERDVLSMIVDGFSAAAIAEKSFVSVATVRTQIRSILQKLGVNSQLAAAALARNSGWALTGTAGR
jgi:two-component system nitrate/nitrite response regulator NarL